MTDGLDIHPVWKQAAREAVKEFSYGDTISLEWLRSRLEIYTPDLSERMTLQQHRTLAFDLLRKVEEFKRTMLEDHARLLVNVRNQGYRIVEPPQQTGVALERFVNDFHKSWHKAMAAMMHINASALSLEDMRDNTEARLKLAYLKKMAAAQIEGGSAKELGHDLHPTQG
jgi:hypothetical protein